MGQITRVHPPPQESRTAKRNPNLLKTPHFHALRSSPLPTCGFRPCSCQIRRTLLSLIPTAVAIARVVQRAALTGFLFSVIATTCFTWRSVIVRVLPGRRVSSFSPSIPRPRKRFRHRDAVSRSIPMACAISLFRKPSAASSTMRARSATPLCKRPLDSSLECSCLVLIQADRRCHTHVIVLPGLASSRLASYCRAHPQQWGSGWTQAICVVAWRNEIFRDPRFDWCAFIERMGNQ